MNGKSEEESPTNGKPPLEQHARWHFITQRRYDPERDAELTSAIIYALAAAMDVDPTDVRSPLLHDVVDVPAIEHAFLYGNPDGGSPSGKGSVTFRYREFLVMIDSDGWVRVYGPNGQPEV